MERFCVVSIALLLNCGLLLAGDDAVVQEFNTKYLAWKEYVSRPEVQVQSLAGTRFENEFFAALVAMGLPALPQIAAKMEDDASAGLLWKAIEQIAKVKITGVYDRTGNRMDFPEYPTLKPGEDVYLHWWKEGRFRTGERFAELYGKWKSLKAEQKDEEAQETYQKIVDLGIAVLPYLVEQVEREPQFISAISKLTDGALPPTATPAECRKWWTENRQRFELPPRAESEQSTSQEPATQPVRQRRSETARDKNNHAWHSPLHCLILAADVWRVHEAEELLLGAGTWT